MISGCHFDLRGCSLGALAVPAFGNGLVSAPGFKRKGLLVLKPSYSCAREGCGLQVEQTRMSHAEATKVTAGRILAPKGGLQPRKGSRNCCKMSRHFERRKLIGFYLLGIFCR